MSTSRKEITAFVSGLVIGGTSAFILVKNKYETLAEDRINTFKEDMKSVREKETKEKVEASKNKEPLTKYASAASNPDSKLPLASYSSIISSSGYNPDERIDYTKPQKVEESEETEEQEEPEVESESEELYSDDEEEEAPEDRLPEEPIVNYEDPTPRIITAEEYDEVNGYDKLYMSVYEDGVFADEVNDIMDDYATYVGTRPDIFFDDMDLSYGDILYFRNDAKRTDTKLVRENVMYEESGF